MSTTGTNGNDTLVGTTANDSISGGNGNDVIDGGGGNDNLSGDNGNDVIDGGSGNDTISGGNGNDVLDGGSGSDLLYGNNGDDTAVYVAIDNLTAHDVYEGGNGTDTLVLKLTQSQLAEMNASTVFADFRAAGANTAFDFSAYGFSFSINLTAKGFERLQTVLIADPAPPVAHADTNAITEDAASSTVAGNVLANDTLGGIADATLSLTNAGALAGLYGTLTLNTDGSYSYLLDQTNAALAGLNDGDTLQEIFAYTVTDGYSHATSQLTITINGHTDAGPLFTEGNDVVDFNTVVAGTYINGTQFDALGGDDTIILPANATEAAQAGYATGVPFRTGDGNNTVVGGALNDVVIGGAGADTIDGGGGNDTLLGGAGDDLLIGGAGLDTLNGGTGFNRLSYADLPVQIELRLDLGVVRKGTGPNPVGVDSISNFQEIVGSNFSDTMSGDVQDNRFFGGGGNDFILGGPGNDDLDGGEGADAIFGGAGNDRLVGGSTTGHDTLAGEEGDDVFVSDGSFNMMVGGDGIDTVDYSGTLFNMEINLATGLAGRPPVRQVNPIDDPFTPDSLSGIENVIGTQYDDTITGNDINNRIFAGDGNDIVVGGMGSDDLDGGAGINRLDYQRSLIPVVINLADGVAIKGDPTFFVFGTDQVRNFRDVAGSNVGDHIVGDTQDNLLLGFGGNDVLDGGAGNDRIEGGAGDDVMIASAGNDTFDGGDGIDRVIYQGSGVGVTIILGPDGSARKGDAADAPVDQLRNVEHVIGSDFDDHLTGDAGNNLLVGGSGSDILEGGAGNDFLFGDHGDNGDIGDTQQGGNDILDGGAGDDWLLGGGGDDIFIGGLGHDSMHGFAGDDLFISDAIDNSILGYEGIDTIDYSGVLFDLEVNFTSGWAGAKPLFSVPIDSFSGIENVIGGQGNDRIIGDSNDNRIDGFHGSDVLAGLGGQDVFHIDLSDTHVGNDTIMDFQIGIDKISLGGGLHASLSELNPHQVGANTVLDLGGGVQLTLFQLNASLLTNNDFLFA